ncbi:bifunctional folylpolyglutamate synthase/dihydrofolate synthase [Patescibacteria group bacterium]
MNIEEALIFMKSHKCYQDAVNFTYDSENFNLKRFKNFLKDYGLDFKGIKFFHVGGSKGKGSVATFLAEYLKELGKDVGLFTSPFITDIRESFWINGEIISEKHFCDSVERLRDYLDNHPNLGITYFELLTALVLEYFIERGVEYAVMEVGLGGRLDSTNVISPELSILSTIEKEHTAVLGETYQEIISEKLGIVKEGVPVVVGFQNQEVRKIMEHQFKANENIIWAEDLVDIQKSKFNGSSYNVDFKVGDDFFEDVIISGINKAMIKNVTVTLLGLRKYFGSLEEKCLRAVSSKYVIRGRMQLIELKDGKKIILDMAHTKESINNLMDSLDEVYGQRRYVFLLSFLKDKNVAEMLEQIEDRAEKIVFCKSHQKRSFGVDELNSFIKNQEIEFFNEADIKKALKKSIDLLKYKEILIVTGSHFLVGEVLIKLNSLV